MWYETERCAALNGREGPLDVYGLRIWKMIRMSAEHPTIFFWGTAARYRNVGADWLVAVYLQTSLIPKALDRTRARASIVRDAKVAGLSLGRYFIVPVASPDLKPLAVKTVRSCVARLRSTLPRWSAYVLVNTTFTILPSTSWKTRLMSGQANIRSFNFDTVSTLNIHPFLSGHVRVVFQRRVARLKMSSNILSPRRKY